MKGNYRKETYLTWQEASAAAIKAGITDRDDYLIRYDRLDPLLPSQPGVFYKGTFPGWKKFLCYGFYETWTESRDAAIRLGVTSWKDYREMRYLDRKLRSRPEHHYSDFVYGNEQFIIKSESKPELYHEFNHEKEFETCY